MPPLDEISKSTASKAAVAVVLSSTGMQDYENTSCQQDAFGTSTQSSLAGVQDEFGSISGQHPRRSSGQPVASQEEIDIQYGIRIVYEKWAGNGPRILGRCRQTHTKPPGSAAVGPREEFAVYVICDNRLERPAVAIVAMNPRSLWTPLL
jgi:hypothetical protein